MTYTSSVLRSAALLPLLVALAKGSFFLVSGDEAQVIDLPGGQGSTTGDATQSGIVATDAFGCSGSGAGGITAAAIFPYCNADSADLQEFSMSTSETTGCGAPASTSLNFHIDVSGTWWDMTIGDDPMIVAKCVAPAGCVSGKV